MFWALGFIPCLVWKQRNGEFVYANHPFFGKECLRKPEPDWEWLDVGDVCGFPDIGCWFHLGKCGVLAQFKTELEAEKYGKLYNATHLAKDN